jgi:predicted transposase YdaD
MQERLTEEADQAQSATLWTAAYVLMGLKYERELAGKLLQGVRAMKELVTYQAILAEREAKGEARGEVKGEVKGRVHEACHPILRIGTKRFSKPPVAVRQALEQIGDVARLEQLSDRLLDISGWDELLPGP